MKEKPELPDLVWKSQTSFSQTSATTRSLFFQWFSFAILPLKKTRRRRSELVIIVHYISPSPSISVWLVGGITGLFSERAKRAGVVRGNSRLKGCFWRVRFPLCPLNVLYYLNMSCHGLVNLASILDCRSPEALLQFPAVSCLCPPKTAFFCRKVHLSAGKYIFLQESASFCRKTHAVYSGGLRIMSGSLFLDDMGLPVQIRASSTFSICYITKLLGSQVLERATQRTLPYKN